ncbi:Gx [Charleville virus]|uniref:Gx n=1 Tax=Charleville virus TaxID=318842 RepID=A0A3Q8TND9_9RHAB|nr:Gx [Charleville virus]AZL49337.1 Gx [Charleville virus]
MESLPSFWHLLFQYIVITHCMSPVRKVFIGLLLIILVCVALSGVLSILCPEESELCHSSSHYIQTTTMLLDTVAIRLNGLLSVLKHGIGLLMSNSTSDILSQLLKSARLPGLRREMA